MSLKIINFNRTQFLKEPLGAGILDSKAILFWDPALGSPNRQKIEKLMEENIDVWHGGLALQMGGLPHAINFVAPNWMLNADSSSIIESTSWRLSLRACLVRTDVIKRMGWLCPEFETLDAASLEMGHRWIRRGVFMRYVPQLAGQAATSEISNLKFTMPFEDELRFIDYRFGRKWTYWVFLRALLTGYVSLPKGLMALGRLLRNSIPMDPEPYRAADKAKANRAGGHGHAAAFVSVLLPTLNRYAYLEKVLEGLRNQTMKAKEIIIVDQTPLDARKGNPYQKYVDLPLRIIFQDEPGQCSSRNAGLRLCRGTHVLFLDDDDEVAPDLIERHLHNLRLYECPVSSGVAHEAGVALPDNFTFLRISDVFPTNNTMIQREILKKSGLFDLAYNHKERADHDLGMRLYLGGAKMVLDPTISVLHHHASQGGLRTHQARVVTYGACRRSLIKRHLPTASEIYLSLRYFNPQQVREDLLLRTMGTFTVEGSVVRKIPKSIISFIVLPHTLYKIQKKYKEALQMLQTYPQIPRTANRKSLNDF